MQANSSIYPLFGLRFFSSQRVKRFARARSECEFCSD